MIMFLTQQNNHSFQNISIPSSSSYPLVSPFNFFADIVNPGDTVMTNRVSQTMDFICNAVFTLVASWTFLARLYVL